MTQEEKQLLYKVLCAMLPYGVKLHVEYTFKLPFNAHTIEGDTDLVEINIVNGEYRVLTSLDEYVINRFPLEYIKPYLRPMSRMTVPEKLEWIKLTANPDPTSFVVKVGEFLHSHHLDYQDLIPMGLALEAPAGMYKNN